MSALLEDSSLALAHSKSSTNIFGSKKSSKGKGGKAIITKAKKSKSGKKKRHEKYSASKKNKYFTKTQATTMGTILETESEGEDQQVV